MPRFARRTTRCCGDDGNAIDGGSIFTLIDEYEDDDNIRSPSQVQLEAIEIPKLPEVVVDVDDSSEGEEIHDPMALTCPCKECRLKRKKGKSIFLNGNRDPHLKCNICLAPTVQGRSHYACSLVCGHIYGKKCIEPWLKARSPPTCPVCNAFNPPNRIISLYVESAKDEFEDEGKIRVAESNIREDGLRQKIASFVELTNNLFESLKLYGEVLTPVVCLR